MTISRDQVVNRLREANYTFKRRGKRTEIWRKRGSPQRVALPTCKTFEERHARLILSQAGLTLQEINRFIAAAAG